MPKVDLSDPEAMRVLATRVVELVDPPEEVSAIADTSWRATDLDFDAKASDRDLLGVFERGTWIDIIGPQSSGKTMAIFATLVEIARSGEHVLAIDLEMSHRLTARRLLDALLVPRAEAEALVNGPNRRIHYVRPTGRIKAGDIERLIASVPAPLAAVMIDSITGLIDLHGLDSNADTSIERIAREAVRPYTDAGAAVFAIDHTGHNDPKRARGSSRKGEVGEHRFGVEIHTAWGGCTGASTFTCRRSRTGLYEIGEALLFSMTPGHWEWSSTARTAATPENVLREIIAILEERGSLQNADTARKAVKRSDSTVRAALTLGVNTQALAKTPTGYVLVEPSTLTLTPSHSTQ